MKNIIILDSKAYVRNRIKELVSEYDIHVYEAVNSIQLFNVLSEVNNEVSIIVMEINLEKESGLEVINKLKKKGLEIPILIVTSENRRKEFAKTIKAGIVDYILKPFNEKVLVDRITKGMEKKNIGSKKVEKSKDKEINNQLNKKLQVETINEIKKYSLMMITLFKTLDEFTVDLEKEYSALGSYLYFKLRNILGDTDGLTRYGIQNFIATFNTHDIGKEATISKNISEFFKDIKEKDKRFEGYYLECAFVHCPEEGNNNEELISKVTYKILDKIDELKRLEKR